MPHHRKRHFESSLSKALSFSPSVSLVGMRQVGKSTLLRAYSKQYFTFDDEQFRHHFSQEGLSLFIGGKYPIAFDEVQKYPPIFDQIKISIDEKKVPGRFLLSGSVRFAARKQIRESLTGRNITLELFPFTLSECHSKPQSLFLNFMTQSEKWDTLIARLQHRSWASSKDLLLYRQLGGLPGICFRRDPSVRQSLLDEHLATLLERDIQLVRKVTLPYRILKTILEEIASKEKQGLVVNYSDIARITGTSVPTLKAVLEAMEALFLIRPYGDYYFIEDSGLSSHLQTPATHMSRQDMIRLLYLELRTQLPALKHDVDIKPYATRGGIDIPFLIQTKSGKSFALGIDPGDRPSNKTIKSLSWSQKRFKNLTPLILCQTKEAFETMTGIPCLPWEWVF